jgi:hypothetical protein
LWIPKDAISAVCIVPEITAAIVNLRAFIGTPLRSNLKAFWGLEFRLPVAGSPEDKPEFSWSFRPSATARTALLLAARDHQQTPTMPMSITCSPLPKVSVFG